MFQRRASLLSSRSFAQNFWPVWHPMIRSAGRRVLIMSLNEEQEAGEEAPMLSVADSKDKQHPEQTASPILSTVVVFSCVFAMGLDYRYTHG
jgi:hypothetical protein